MHRIWVRAVAIAVVLAACSNGATTAGGGGGEGPGATTPADCAPSGASLSVSAIDTEFDAQCLAAPAGEKFTVNFDNEENVPHNFAIFAGSGQGKALFDTGVFSGPGSRELDAGPLEAGTYTFRCVVHPNMVGTFVVA